MSTSALIATLQLFLGGFLVTLTRYLSSSPTPILHGAFWDSRSVLTAHKQMQT